MKGLRGFSLRHKITLMFAALLFLAVLVVGAIVFYQSRQLVVQSLSEELLGIVQKGVSLTDPARYAELVAGGSDTAPYYTELREVLNDLRDKTGSKYLYTMQKVGDKYIYVVDGMPLDSEDASAFGDEEDPANISSAMLKAFDGETVVGDLDNTKEWGKLLSAYCPIKGSDGKVLGILGVDFEANKVYSFLARTMIVLLLILVIILGVGLLLGYLMARQVTKPLEELVAVSRRVRDGDLTMNVDISKVERGDEIGDLYATFGDMVSHLRSLVQKIQIRYDDLVNGVEVLDDSAASAEDSMQSISTSINDVAVGSERQLGKLGDAVSEVARMADYIGQIDENSGVARELSHDAEMRAKNGCAVLAGTREQILAIDERAANSAEVIRALSERIAEVTGFMQVIAAIAKQTNLLALNAAIESARAGKEGMGFAVVAREIKTLAEESAAAADNVAKTISQIYSQSAEAVNAIESTVTEVHSGVSAIDRVEEEFASVLEKSQQASANISRVAEAVRSISQVSLEIRDGMEKVSAVSEETNAVSEEVMDMVSREKQNIQRIKDQSQILVHLAQDLREEIQKFHL